MKRDMDLIRDLLLAIEASPKPELPEPPELDGRSADVVMYHVRMLREAGLIDALDTSDMGGEFYQELSLNWHGHEFLDDIRDPEIWSKTKAGALRVGSWSLGVLAELAKGALIAKAQSLGIPVSP